MPIVWKKGSEETLREVFWEPVLTSIPSKMPAPATPKQQAPTPPSPVSGSRSSARLEGLSQRRDP